MISLVKGIGGIRSFSQLDVGNPVSNLTGEISRDMFDIYQHQGLNPSMKLWHGMTGSDVKAHLK